MVMKDGEGEKNTQKHLKLMNQLESSKNKIITGKTNEDTVMGSTEYIQVNAGTRDMHAFVLKDDGAVVTDATVYYPTWPL
jgi:hypothetical protein